MATLVRYNTFKELKKSDTPPKKARATTSAQKNELEAFLKSLSKKKTSNVKKAGG